jgi:hypothetical protein
MCLDSTLALKDLAISNFMVVQRDCTEYGVIKGPCNVSRPYIGLIYQLE